MYLAHVNFNGRKTPIWTDLKTAMVLKQLEADYLRSRRHLRQEFLTWRRRHSDRKVWWEGVINGEVIVSMTKN